MFPLSSGINNIMGMKERYDKLQTQLSSGLKASNLGEMGSDRYFDLALRQRVSRIESYQSNIKTVNLRLNVLDRTVGPQGSTRSKPMRAPPPCRARAARPASTSRRRRPSPRRASTKS